MACALRGLSGFAAGGSARRALFRGRHRTNKQTQHSCHNDNTSTVVCTHPPWQCIIIFLYLHTLWLYNRNNGNTTFQHVIYNNNNSKPTLYYYGRRRSAGVLINERQHQQRQQQQQQQEQRRRRRRKERPVAMSTEGDHII